MKCKKCGKPFTKQQKLKKQQKFCSQICCSRFHNVTHDMSNTHFYKIWCRIKRVCDQKTDSRYPLYGGRGIRYEWVSFEEFRKDMFSSFQRHLKRHGKINTTIERKNNDGNYCKENCKWATRKEQARNRTSSSHITFQDKTLNLAEWAEILDMPRGALYLRINRYKWTIEKAFTTPLR